MFVCKDCGAHYNSEFLQCPQCGSTKRVTESEEKNNNSIIGTIISIAIILGLLGLIGAGVYYLLNPFVPASPISDIDYIDTTTTSSNITRKTNSTTTKITTTTTKLVGSEGQVIGSHTYTIPEGFTLLDFSSIDYSSFNMPGDTQCISSSDLEQYCIGIKDNYVFSFNSSNMKEANETLAAGGFSELIKAQFYGKTYYYAYMVSGDQIVGGLFKNIPNAAVTAVFSIHASTVDEESLYKLISIINSIH